MNGFIDLHCHYLPAIDDGVRTTEDGIALVQGLRSLGYARVIATPHIRTAMFENRKPGLERTFAAFAREAAQRPDMPEFGLGAEHFFDDIFWELFTTGGFVPYPGQHAALVEFPAETIPMRVADRFFEMQIKGVQPVLAHPERYAPLFRRTDPLDLLLDVGVLPQLDVMSLTGRYGRRPRKAAMRMLEEGVYALASSDCHRSTDVPIVEKALEILRHTVGDEEAQALLSDNPRAILEGTFVS